MICKDSLSYKIMDYIRKSIDDEPKYVKIFDECKILIEQGINIAILQAINDNANYIDFIDKSGDNGLFNIINNDRKQLKAEIINDMDMKKKKRSSAPFLARDYTGKCKLRNKNSIEAIRKATNYYLYDNNDYIPIQNETLEILMKLYNYFNITINPIFENITEQQQKIIDDIHDIINYVIQKFTNNTTTSGLNDFGYTNEKEVNDDMKALGYYTEDNDDDLDKLLEEISKGKLFHGEDISELSEMMNHRGWFSKINKKEPEKIVEHIDFDEYSEEDNYVSHEGLMKKLKEYFNSHKTPEKKTKKTKKPIKKSGAKEVHDSLHDFEKRLNKLTKGL